MGVIVSSEPREDMKEPIRALFKTQQKYLLAPSTHWNLKEDYIPKKNYNHTRNISLCSRYFNI